MKRTATYLIILIALFLGCKKVDNSTGTTPIPPIKKDKISGLVQKGPYINGTQIIMYVLDDKLAQTGKVFNTQITDNKGSFQLTNVELSSKFVQLAANGYYFNEASNAITIAPLQLNALTDVTDASTINVNILTHLEKRRVEYLVKSGKTFTEAKKTAQQEIQAIFGIQIAQSTVSEKLDIATAGDANAILLAISLIIQGELSVGDLSELLATISADLEEDGLMTNNSVMTKLRANAKLLHLDSIRQNLVKRYQDLGVTATIPDFEKYINLFLVQSAEKPSAESKAARLILNHTATLTGTVNPNGAETVVTFEYGVTTSYGSSVVAKESPLYFDTARSVSADIINLDSLTTYHYRIKAENGKGITYSADSTFTTLKDETDIVSGLVAYYPFSGNANDESGNGNHGIVNGVTLTTDQFGNENKAYSFNGNSNYITIPYSPVFDLPNSFTISVWLNTTDVDLGQRIIDRSTGGTSDDWLVDLSPNPTDLKKIRCLAGGVTTNLPYSNPSVIQNNTWYLVTITYDMQNIKFYINGIIDKVIPLNSSTPISNNFVRIGASTSGGAGFFSGKIDDIRIYNRALSQAEITYLLTH
jgi:hypothetical protein